MSGFPCCLKQGLRGWAPAPCPCEVLPPVDWWPPPHGVPRGQTQCLPKSPGAQDTARGRAGMRLGEKKDVQVGERLLPSLQISAHRPDAHPAPQCRPLGSPLGIPTPFLPPRLTMAVRNFQRSSVVCLPRFFWLTLLPG